MKALTWQDITVQQFQDIVKLGSDKTLDEMGLLEKAICILHDMTESQVEELSVSRFTELAKQSAFVVSSKVPGKPVRSFKVGTKRYGIVYNPTRLTHRQYMEILSFGNNPVENMHLIMASLVNPITWYGRKKKNSADDHQKISSDILQARVVDVYHSCVFFCKLYVSLIQDIKPFLVKQMMEKGATRATAEQAVEISQSAMAGFIPPKN